MNSQVRALARCALHRSLRWCRIAGVEIGVWEREDVSDWSIREVEQAGSTQNTWLEDPATGHVWLHKDTFTPSNGIEQGEDWSEVISTQVAQHLGVPCAQTRLCRRGERRGSLSLSVRPNGYDLWEGHVVMERAGVLGYFPTMEGNRGKDELRPDVVRPGHSLRNIRYALQEVGPPSSLDGIPGMDGFDVFAGYLVLDALIANQDRHEQNWAVLTPRLASASERLAPTYDHASSLGFQLTDDRRQRCLSQRPRLQAWAENGRAGRFEYTKGEKPVTLVEHAAAAVDMCSPQGAQWWGERVHRLDLEPISVALRGAAIPEMSDHAARFVCELLDLNLWRLRDAIPGRT